MIIEKIDGVPQMIDYMRHIQPLFDKYCVKCHNPRNANAGVIMTGDLSPHYIQSRFVLAVYGHTEDVQAAAGELDVMSVRRTDGSKPEDADLWFAVHCPGPVCMSNAVFES